jgi:hypothetical protein
LKERTHSHSAQYMRARKKRILRPHNDALSVAAMRVSNPDHSPDASNKTTKTLRHAPKGNHAANPWQLFACRIVRRPPKERSFGTKRTPRSREQGRNEAACQSRWPRGDSRPHCSRSRRCRRQSALGVIQLLLSHRFGVGSY